MKFLLGLLMAASPAMWAQTSVFYTDNLSDPSTVDFSFTLSGGLSANDYIAIYFDQTVYTNLVIPSEALPGYDPGTGCSTDWCLQVFQPDLGIPAPGELDLIPNSGTATEADPFLLNADLLQGQASLGQSFAAPTFTVYDGTTEPNDVVQAGTVQPLGSEAATPEPASLSIMALGITVLLFWPMPRRLART
jgi:hypothetical protein